ncbi:MAG: YraN family protein, partial [Candidatus Cryptobacteroides sp.]
MNSRNLQSQSEKKEKYEQELKKMNGKGKLGKAGEDEVCNYLISRGHTILKRNWRSGKQEIDIISLACDGIHFV